MKIYGTTLYKSVALVLFSLVLIPSFAFALPPVPGDYDEEGPGPTCPNLSQTLSYNRRLSNPTEQVLHLQSFLTDNLSLNEDITTGFFGKKTDAYVRQFQSQNGIDATGVVGPITRAKISEACGGGPVVQPPTGSIRVTAPKGGEQWEEGILNTVTWTPYQYNPDINPAKDVTAYLEEKSCDAEGPCPFVTLGKVEESGKASIHWITGELNSATQGGVLAPDGGGYYIRVVNNKTGAWDRSDAPFTLLPKPVDLKINKSDGPISATAGVSLIATWTAYGSVSCRLDNAYDAPVPSVYPIPEFDNLPTSGSRTIYVPQQQNWYVSIGCLQKNGTTLYDSVVLNVGAAVASLKIVNPNGGELLDSDKDFTVHWNQTGIGPAVSIALYSNDQWYTWIQKSAGADIVNGVGHYSWNPKVANVETGRDIYKIYITGQKADGTGYVEDKSDAPFGFLEDQNSNRLSSWGQKLGVKDDVIPNGKFRAYYFNRDGNGYPATQTQPQQIINEPFLNYSSSGGYGASLDRQIGAYFVGKFTYGYPSSPPIYFDLSNPQWDTARLYIDGQLAHTYGGNSGTPTYMRNFAGGTHTFELEYDSRWHAGRFAMRVGRIIYPQEYVSSSEVPSILNKLESTYGSLKVAAASIYDSGDDKSGGIDIKLPDFNSPTVLVFSSYGPAVWHWSQSPVNINQVKAIVVYSFAGGSIPDLSGSIPVYRIRGDYIGSGNGLTTAANVAQKIGRNVDSFATEYSPTALTLPAITQTTSSLTSTYRGYMNGSLFITTQNVPESYAYDNCKLNAANNPTKSIRCTWGDKVVFESTVGIVCPLLVIKLAPCPTGTMYVSGGYGPDKCELPGSCVPTKPSCPAVAIPSCSPGSSYISGGVDSNGCKLSDKCVAPQCPVYPTPQCSPGSSFKIGGIDSKGCSLPDTCGPVQCPIAQSAPCSLGQKSVPGGTDSNGCALPNRCEADSSVWSVNTSYSVNSCGSVGVSWSAVNPKAGDWLGLYRYTCVSTGENSSSCEMQFQNRFPTGGAPSGSTSFSTSGDVQIRYYRDDQEVAGARLTPTVQACYDYSSDRGSIDGDSTRRLMLSNIWSAIFGW